MIINVCADSTTSRDKLELIHKWMKECMDYYNFGKDAKHTLRTKFLTKEGSDFFINWVKDHKKIKITYWKLEDPLGSQMGFEIEEDPNLTLEMLK